MVLDKETLIRLNQHMLQLGAPTDRDDIGYNAIDFSPMEYIGRYKGTQLPEELLEEVAGRLYRYKNTQLSEYASDLKETVDYYKKKLHEKQNTVTLDEWLREQSRDEFLSKEIHFSGVKKDENGIWVGMRCEAVWFDNFSEYHGGLKTQEYAGSKEQRIYLVRTDKVLKFLEDMKTKGEFGYEPDWELEEFVKKQLPKYLEQEAKEREKAPKKEIRVIESDKSGMLLSFDGYVREVNDMKITYGRNHVKSIKSTGGWNTWISYDVVEPFVTMMNQNGYDAKHLIVYKETKQKEFENANKSDYTLIDVSDHKKYPLPFKPYEFQLEDAKEILQHKRMLLAHDMGCVSGKSKVRIKEKGKGTKEVTIENLYRLFQASNEIKIKCLVNGRFAFLPIKAVIDKGIQPTIKVFTQNTLIECTSDHEFYTENGWVEAQNLSVGDCLFTNGEAQRSKLKPNGYPNIVRKIDKNGYVRLVGNGTKNMPDYKKMTSQGGIYEHHQVWYENTGHVVQPNEVIHHKDMNKQNNDFSNLQLMSDVEHKKLHSDINAKNFPQFNKNLDYIVKNGKKIYFVPKKEQIIDIRPSKEQQVYDIAIDHEEIHNFVCNQIVVHNCGKTLIAGMVGTSIPVQKLVIVPESLRLNWRKEIRNLTPNADVKVLYSKDDFELGKDWTIIGYATAVKFLGELLKAKIPCVFIDEAHNCKAINNSGEPTSKRARAVLSICENAEYIYPMTGTPIPTSNRDLFNIFKMLDAPEVITGDKWDFFRYGKKFCNGFQNGYGWDFTGSSNTEELNQILSKNMVRHLKSEVLPYLTKQRVFLPIESKSKEYQGIERRLEYPKEKDTYMGLAMAGRRILSKEKCEASIDLAESMLQEGRSVVIVSEFNETLDRIAEKFAGNCCSIRGGMQDKAKQKAIDDFQSGKVKVCALNTVAGGVGITLTKASDMIICDYDWTPSNMSQVEDRICRSGQTEACTIHYIYCENSTLDVTFMDMITSKSENIDRVVDAAENTMNFVETAKGGSYMEQLAAVVEKRRWERLKTIVSHEDFSIYNFSILANQLSVSTKEEPKKQWILPKAEVLEAMDFRKEETVRKKLRELIATYEKETKSEEKEEYTR